MNGADRENKAFVLIDTPNLIHRAFRTVGDLQHEDIPTGVIYGLLEQIRTIAFDPRVCSHKIIFFFDSGQSYRRLAFPDYKKKRRENTTLEEDLRLSIMHQQVRYLRTTLLPDIGFPCFMQTGLESDDLIAKAAERINRTVPAKGIIVGSDGDLYQCITEKVHYYNPDRIHYYTRKKFETEKGIAPELWGEVKAVAGCSGDGVPGVPRVGEKTAIRFLRKELPPRLKAAQAIGCEEGIKVIERNRPLVILPHERTRPILIEHISFEFHFDVFKLFMERLGIVSYLEGPKYNQWKMLMDKRLKALRRKGKRK